MGGPEVEAFLTHLAVDRNVSSSTQSSALNAVAFLCNKFLDRPVGDIGQFSRSKRQSKLPVVLTKSEITALLDPLTGAQKLMASLLYGSGLRRIELLRLRLKDVDFDHLQLRIWFGKGAKHRLTTLAEELVQPLMYQKTVVVA
jgi:integrase